MNRDDILAKSRKENSGGDEREAHVRMRAGNISYAVGGVLCVLISFVVTVFLEGLDLVSYVCWLIYCGMGATEYWIRAVQLKTKWEIIGAIISSLLFIGYLLLTLGII